MGTQARFVIIAALFCALMNSNPILPPNRLTCEQTLQQMIERDKLKTIIPQLPMPVIPEKFKSTHT